MEVKSLVLTTLLSLASATPVFPVIKPFASSKVSPRKETLHMPYPTTFFDLPTGEPRSGPEPTWRHKNGVGVYKDPYKIAPLWYSENEDGWRAAVVGGNDGENITPTKTTTIVPRTEVAKAGPTPVNMLCYNLCKGLCHSRGLEGCIHSCGMYLQPQPDGYPPCNGYKETGFDDPLRSVNLQLLSDGEMWVCWSACSQFGHEACERCDQKLRLGGVTPSTQPVRYDPWGRGIKQARDSVDLARKSMAYERLWECAVQCMRDGATPCTSCDALWDESQKMVSARGHKEEVDFWNCVKDCSRNRLISCVECEAAWRQQLAMATPAGLSVEKAVAYAEIWNCVVHCAEEKTEKTCRPCDELWRRWDAGLPPFGPGQTGLITATDDLTPSNWDATDLELMCRISACVKGCNPAVENNPSDYCKYCEELVKSLPPLVPRPWVRRIITAEPSKTIDKRLLYVWDPVTGVFRCTAACAKGKDYYTSCLPCLYDKGIPVDGDTSQVGQTEVVKTNPEQKSDAQAPYDANAPKMMIWDFIGKCYSKFDPTFKGFDACKECDETVKKGVHVVVS